MAGPCPTWWTQEAGAPGSRGAVAGALLLKASLALAIAAAAVVLAAALSQRAVGRPVDDDLPIA